MKNFPKFLITPIIFCFFLASCGQSEKTEKSTEITVSSGSVGVIQSSGSLTKEQSEILDSYLKKLEKALRDDGHFDEATIQKTLSDEKIAKTKKILGE